MGYSGRYTRKSPIRCQKHQENELRILKHDLWLPSKVELLNARTMFHSLHFGGGVAARNDLVYGLCMHLTTQNVGSKHSGHWL